MSLTHWDEIRKRSGCTHVHPTGKLGTSAARNLRASPWCSACRRRGQCALLAPRPRIADPRALSVSPHKRQRVSCNDYVCEALETLKIPPPRTKHDQRHRRNSTIHQRRKGDDVKYNRRLLISSISDERDAWHCTLGTSVKHGVESYRVTRLLHILYVLKTSLPRLAIAKPSGNGGVNHGDDAGPRVLWDRSSASTAHESKVSSTSVSSTRSKALISQWWVCAVRPFNRMEHVSRWEPSTCHL